jgi:YHS domain-containing protein
MDAVRWASGLVCLLMWVAIGGPAFAHDVKDPVCRMTVDSDTARYKHKLGNRTFYFCSKKCVDTFAKAPQKYERLAEVLAKQDLHEYAVELRAAENPVAGTPVALEIAVRYAKSGELVRNFELVHERLLHLIMTTEDMSWFEHQHPKRGEDGLFRLTWTFPRPGRYRLYADFTPADGDNQVKPLTLAVGGGPEKHVPLKADRKLSRMVGDLRFELSIQGGPLRVEQPALLTYRVEDGGGRPLRDLQPFIGAMGHVLAISRDGKEVIHTHAIQSVSQPAMGGEKEPFRVTQAMVTEKGPAFSFKLTLPTSGLYRVWAQFMRSNRVYTVPFTFDVADIWAPRQVQNAAQKATVVIDGKYLPGKVAVRRGSPVALTFVRKEEAGCGGVVHFPTLGIKRTLKPGERTVVTFTPRKAGRLPFTCGMAMYRGELIVK